MIRNTLALIGLIVVGFVGAGWYLKWYTFDHAEHPDGGKRLSIDVDADKVTGDLGKVKDRIGDAVRDLREDRSADSAPQVTEGSEGGAAAPASRWFPAGPTPAAARNEPEEPRRPRRFFRRNVRPDRDQN